MGQKSPEFRHETTEMEIMGKFRGRRISAGGEGGRACEPKMCGFPQRVVGGGA